MIKKFTRFSITSLTIFFFAVFFSCIIFAQNTAEQTTSLELNKSLERKIAGDAEKQNFQIALDVNQYAKVVIEQTQVDVSARLYDADGKLLNTYDHELRLKRNEIIEFVAPQTATYRIEIKAGSKMWAGIYKICLTSAREATAKDRLADEARILLVKAEEAKNAEKFDEAVSLYHRALETFGKRTASEGVPVNWVLNELIITNLRKGDYPAARTLLDRADETAKNSDPEHPQSIRTMYLLGSYYNSIEDAPKAMHNYRRSLANYEKILGGEHPMLNNVLLALSSLSSYLGDFDQAAAHLHRAEKNVEKNYGAEHSMMNGIVNNLGVLYLKKNDLTRAEQHFLKVISVLEKMNEGETVTASITLVNLGLIHYKGKNYRRALDYYEKALAIREKVLGSKHLNVSWVLNNMSSVYVGLGERAKALDAQRRAREIAENVNGLYDGTAVGTIFGSARIFAAQGEIEKAVAYQKLHDERFEKILTLNLTIGSERQKLQYVKRLERLTSTSISLHLNAARNNQSALDLAALAVLQRKGRVLDAVADNLAAIRRRANETDRALLDRLNDVNARLAKLTLGKPAKMPLDEHQKQIAELEQQKEQIEIEIGDQNAKFAVQMPSVTLDAIKSEIPEDAALVEFAGYLPLDFKNDNSDDAYGEPRYVAYVLRKNGAVKYAELGDKKTLDKTIADLRKALGDAKSKNVKLAARSADEKIMQPVRALSAMRRTDFRFARRRSESDSV